MNEHDQDRRLRERLREWPGLEPRLDFEDAFWRRVATAAEPAFNGFEAWQLWFGVRPAWAGAAAALIAVAVGVASTLALAQPHRGALALPTPSLQGQSLANSYLAMASGDAP